MQPLLRIQNVPISISYSSKRAQLQQNSKQPKAEVSRIKGRSDIRTQLPRVQIDSTETKASMGLKSAPRSVREFAETGRIDALEATRSYAEEGNRIVDAHGKGNPIIDNVMSRVMTNYETIMTFIPSVRPEMWVEGGTIEMDFTPDELVYNWDVSARPDMEFIPGGVEFDVHQYPEVIIEYLGKPVYVPPSSDPDYVPPPTLNGSA